MSTAGPTPGLRGEAVLLFAFDVAYEIATARVGELLARVPTRFALRPEPPGPKALPLYQPLEIEPALAVGCGGRPGGVLVRVYDVGVVAVTLRVPFELAGLDAARRFHDLRLDDRRPAAAWAAEVCAEVCRELRPATVPSRR